MLKKLISFMIALSFITSFHILVLGKEKYEDYIRNTFEKLNKSITTNDISYKTINRGKSQINFNSEYENIFDNIFGSFDLKFNDDGKSMKGEIILRSTDAKYFFARKKSATPVKIDFYLDDNKLMVLANDYFKIGYVIEFEKYSKLEIVKNLRYSNIKDNLENLKSYIYSANDIEKTINIFNSYVNEILVFCIDENYYTEDNKMIITLENEEYLDLINILENKINKDEDLKSLCNKYNFFLSYMPFLDTPYDTIKNYISYTKDNYTEDDSLVATIYMSNNTINDMEITFNNSKPLKIALTYKLMGKDLKDMVYFLESYNKTFKYTINADEQNKISTDLEIFQENHLISSFENKYSFGNEYALDFILNTYDLNQLKAYAPPKKEDYLLKILTNIEYVNKKAENNPQYIFVNKSKNHEEYLKLVYKKNELGLKAYENTLENLNILDKPRSKYSISGNINNTNGLNINGFNLITPNEKIINANINLDTSITKQINNEPDLNGYKDFAKIVLSDLKD